MFPLIDVVKAMVAGHAVLACGGMAHSGRPLNQEPTEVILAAA